MSWSRGTEIFEEICDRIVHEVDEARMHPIRAEAILRDTIDALQECGWDDEQPMLEKYACDYAFVVRAFEHNDVKLDREWDWGTAC